MTRTQDKATQIDLEGIQRRIVCSPKVSVPANTSVSKPPKRASCTSSAKDADRVQQVPDRRPTRPAAASISTTTTSKTHSTTKVIDGIANYHQSADGKKLDLPRRQQSTALSDVGSEGQASVTARSISASVKHQGRSQPRNTPRSSTKPGASSAIGSTTRTCTASTGRPSARNTASFLPYLRRPQRPELPHRRDARRAQHRPQLRRRR